MAWVPPADPIFKNNLQKLALQTGNDGSIQAAESVQEGTKGLAESNAKSQTELDQADGSQMAGSETGGNKDMSANRVKYEKIKNVFKMLIDEAEYLIDDRTLEKCRSLPAKQQFSLKIDSIRKSLGIENMEDVQLLVDTLYEFEGKFQREQKAAWDKQLEELERQAAESGLPLQPLPSKPIQEDLEESAQKDPTQLCLNADNLVLALEEFHMEREEQAIQQQLMGNQQKKKSNFETEEQKAEREKKKQQMFWQKLTTVLSPQKLSVWKHLDQSLCSYYDTLTKRQNLIEETGLLNQQNEELKTLLNQYL